MQWHTRSKSEFDIKTELLESEEVLADVFGKVTSDKLLATVVESTGAVTTDVVHRRSKKFSVVRSHSFVHAAKFGSKPFNVVFNVCLQRLQIDTIGV